jgi:uncharacterized 2Fe-2S/4Fe-4S cluster protein (DUF4445 family)
MSPVKLNSKYLTNIPQKTLFEYADELSVRVPTSCKRNGECHECIVEVSKGNEKLSKSTVHETFLRGNYRLACQAQVIDDKSEIHFNVLKRQPKILTDSINLEFKLNPFFIKDNDEVKMNQKGKFISVDKYNGNILGLAVDIGTTTIVINLVNLENGEIIHTTSFENPQRFGGSDVMNRISYDTGKFNGELKSVLISSINFEIKEMVKNLKIRRTNIYEIVVVGNTTMRDIFLGYDVETIGVKPYKSITEFKQIKNEIPHTAITVKSKDVGLRINKNGIVYAAPLISSHLGSDISADLLTIDFESLNDPFLLVDIGTNTEVVLGYDGKYLAASCPAGPAFEGAGVTYAMPGYSGAIEKIEFSANDKIKYEVIDNKTPIGICGSGLIDLIAGLLKTGNINELGVFKNNNNQFEFSEMNNLTISRSDLSALAQAKAANYCGQAIVIQESGIKIDQIDNLFLAGGFANYINIENAIEIGFIPNVQEKKITKIGNASLAGATKMLLSIDSRNQLEKITKNIEHIELETIPTFFDFFVDGCQFKKMEI